MKLSVPALAALVLSAATVGAQVPGTHASDRLPLEPCTLSGVQETVLCGELLRSENPELPDFSFFQEKIPGLYFGLGVTPDGTDLATVAGTHSPYFFADEGALPVGVRAMAHLAVDYLTSRR